MTPGMVGTGNCTEAMLGLQNPTVQAGQVLRGRDRSSHGRQKAAESKMLVSFFGGGSAP